ncbi:D-3-phosphoglycerate dehydrogenase / 2-oxoglutarate reductase [Phycisphaerales bacterium]|nr:D-3-phosphoglycerate dehydrogenase / 2-oxoglutarate reductase [Phycisphaerales bacterium]
MRTSFPKHKIKAVLVEGIHPAGVGLLRDEGFQVEALPSSPDPAKLAKLVHDAHLLGIRSKTDVTAAILDAAPRLLAVGCFCIGTNQVALSHAAHQGVPVFNSPFSNTRSVAELTLAEIIALYRRLTEKSGLMHLGQWDKSAAGAHEVRGRTLGIVGYGHIGSQISVLAEACGMRVLFYDIVSKMPLGNARPVKTLNDLLKDSDVVTLHVPATPLTERMIGPAQLKRMKPGASLINNARGSVVDVDALAAALKSGHLAGAALDVFPVEPAGKGESFESPLRALPNVILTPHVGGSTEEAQASIAEDVATKFIKFVNVGTTTGAVNVPEVELPEQAIFEEPSARKPAGQRRHRILHFHRNVPGVLSKMHTLIAQLGANISAEYLRTTEDIGYVVLDVDPTDGEKVLARLKTVPETIKVRLLW